MTDPLLPRPHHTPVRFIAALKECSCPVALLSCLAANAASHVYFAVQLPGSLADSCSVCPRFDRATASPPGEAVISSEPSDVEVEGVPGHALVTFGRWYDCSKADRLTVAHGRRRISGGGRELQADHPQLAGNGWPP